MQILTASARLPEINGGGGKCSALYFVIGETERHTNWYLFSLSHCNVAHFQTISMESLGLSSKSFPQSRYNT